MDKQELIERMEGLKNLFGNKAEYIEIDTAIRLISELDEPQKVQVPQFVADWIEYCKENHLTITGAFEPVSEHGIGLAETFKGSAYKCTRWALDNQNLFARAWLDGYEVEKEKRYRVNVKNIRTRQGTLNRSKKSGVFIFSNPEENNLYGTKFTRKELEEAGFGEVFNSPLFEVEEVEG